MNISLEEMNQMDPSKISRSALDLVLVNAIEHLSTTIGEFNETIKAHVKMRNMWNAAIDAEGRGAIACRQPRRRN